MGGQAVLGRSFEPDSGLVRPRGDSGDVGPEGVRQTR
jgi:hypothetical protein